MEGEYNKRSFSTQQAASLARLLAPLLHCCSERRRASSARNQSGCRLLLLPGDERQQSRGSPGKTPGRNAARLPARTASSPSRLRSEPGSAPVAPRWLSVCHIPSLSPPPPSSQQSRPRTHRCYAARVGHARARRAGKKREGERKREGHKIHILTTLFGTSGQQRFRVFTTKTEFFQYYYYYDQQQYYQGPIYFKN